MYILCLLFFIKRLSEHTQYMTKFLKLVSAIFYQIFIFSQNDRPLKTMKNVFYFI